MVVRFSDKNFLKELSSLREGLAASFPLLSLGLSMCLELHSCQEDPHWFQLDGLGEKTS